MARHAARRIALQMIYARLLGGEDCGSVLEDEQDMAHISEDQAFVQSALRSTADKEEDYNRIIALLSPERALERIPKLDRAILYLALHELSSRESPPGVIINEAVELAKRFGEETDGRFVNGLLGSVVDGNLL